MAQASSRRTLIDDGECRRHPDLDCTRAFSPEQLADIASGWRTVYRHGVQHSPEVRARWTVRLVAQQAACCCSITGEERAKIGIPVAGLKHMALTDLKSEPMMAHLLSTLDSRHSIGHYGRLVFTMVARHFIEPEELIAQLEKDPECDRAQATSLVRQVEARNYNPPKRERVLDWMRRQDFPICPDPANPGECNVYRNLNFPKEVYDRISEFYTAPDAP